jgi:hypothetical protein
MAFRGWYNDKYRHSLAARGILTKRYTRFNGVEKKIEEMKSAEDLSKHQIIKGIGVDTSVVAQKKKSDRDITPFALGTEFLFGALTPEQQKGAMYYERKGLLVPQYAGADAKLVEDRAENAIENINEELESLALSLARTDDKEFKAFLEGQISALQKNKAIWETVKNSIVRTGEAGEIPSVKFYGPLLPELDQKKEEEILRAISMPTISGVPISEFSYKGSKYTNIMSLATEQQFIDSMMQKGMTRNQAVNAWIKQQQNPFGPAVGVTVEAKPFDKKGIFKVLNREPVANLDAYVEMAKSGEAGKYLASISNVREAVDTIKSLKARGDYAGAELIENALAKAFPKTVATFGVNNMPDIKGYMTLFKTTDLEQLAAKKKAMENLKGMLRAPEMMFKSRLTKEQAEEIFEATNLARIKDELRTNGFRYTGRIDEMVRRAVDPYNLAEKGDLKAKEDLEKTKAKIYAAVVTFSRASPQVAQPGMPGLRQGIGSQEAVDKILRPAKDELRKLESFVYRKTPATESLPGIMGLAEKAGSLLTDTQRDLEVVGAAPAAYPKLSQMLKRIGRVREKLKDAATDLIIKEQEKEAFMLANQVAAKEQVLGPESGMDVETLNMKAKLSSMPPPSVIAQREMQKIDALVPIEDVSRGYSKTIKTIAPKVKTERLESYEGE